VLLECLNENTEMVLEEIIDTYKVLIKILQAERPLVRSTHKSEGNIKTL
jgi:hypothetical protein